MSAANDFQAVGHAPCIRLHRPAFAAADSPLPGRLTGRPRNDGGHELHELQRRHDQMAGDVAPGVLSINTTCLAALVCTRSLAKAGRVMQRNSCSSDRRSAAEAGWQPVPLRHPVWR
jgi:hypothetical protein